MRMRKVLVRGCQVPNLALLVKKLRCFFPYYFIYTNLMKTDCKYNTLYTNKNAFGRMICSPPMCKTVVVGTHPAYRSNWNVTEWEAFHSKIALQKHSNTIFMRYEDMLNEQGCSKKPTLKFDAKKCPFKVSLVPRNILAWKFWNYTTDGCLNSNTYKRTNSNIYKKNSMIYKSRRNMFNRKKYKKNRLT